MEGTGSRTRRRFARAPSRGRSTGAHAHESLTQPVEGLSVNLGVIAARGGSKGFPGKNLRRLAGLPLIVHTILAAQQSRLLEAFLVTTDDPAIADTAREAGAPGPVLR